MPISAVALVVSAVLLQQAPPAAPPPQAAPPPATEVYVASFAMSAEGATLGKPQNISNSPGYDNQPFFSPDGLALFFTSGRSSAPAGGTQQTDIYRYEFATQQAKQVTATTESEYSPTVTPDGKYISVIRVEADQTQRLWKFPLDGTLPMLVLKEVKPVGYHAWLNDTTLALFVLGQPATLQVADTGTGKAEIVAQDIGQSVQKIPGGGVSYVQHSGSGANRTFTISEVTIENGKPTPKRLTAALAGATQVHVAWTPDGTLLMAHDGSLYAWRRGSAEWRVVADLARLGLKNVTRLAVSPMGDRIALVGS